MKYKICHITNVHEPEDGRIFRRACISAALAGYETYLIEKGDSYEKDGVHIVGIGNPQKQSRLYRMTTFAKKAFKKAVEIDADLYHLHDPELLPFVRKLKKLDKKVVFDSHENYFDMILRKNYVPLAKVTCKLINSYIRHVFSKLDGITYPANDDNYRTIQKLCQRTCITGNYPWKSELFDKYTEGTKEDRTACFIGSLTEDHGITEIVKACAQAKYKLYLAGPFYSQEYKNTLFAMPESECVEYLGVIDREYVLDILNRTQVGLCVLHNVGQYYTSRNLSTKVYECMAMALPVILNDSPYNIEMLDRYKFGVYVNPLDTKELVKCLQMFANNNDLRNKMGMNGRELALEKFSWDREQYNLLEMYESILKNS